MVFHGDVHISSQSDKVTPSLHLGSWISCPLAEDKILLPRVVVATQQQICYIKLFVAHELTPGQSGLITALLSFYGSTWTLCYCFEFARCASLPRCYLSNQ